MTTTTPNPAPAMVEKILSVYLKHRSGKDEEFFAFAGRQGAEALKALMETHTL